MRVLFDVGHPGHVHLFRHVGRELVARGHEVLVTASDKDVAIQLLREYGIPYVSLGKPGRGMVGKGAKLAFSAARLLSVAKGFSPDVLVAVSPVRAAPVAWALGRPCIGLDDTEHAGVARRLYMPFVTEVLTPDCYRLNLGHKQVRYAGFHELAYLHPKRFSGDADVLAEAGLVLGERFEVVRFVKSDAVHDVGHSGFSESAKIRLVRALEPHGRVLVSSEGPLPRELARYRMPCRASAMHHLLAFASVYVGDAGTMTTEAVVLGTPAVFCGTVAPLLGNFSHLETKYGLVRSFVESDRAIECAVELASSPSAKADWESRRKRLLGDCIDVTAWLVDVVERYGAVAE
jgi:predicted glycosyltransferase